MENMNMFFKIYELKGLIESMAEIAASDDEYNNPLIDKVESKMKEIITEIQGKYA